jgi:peptidoglycan/LPS O-acetylase OafA/YrhL
MSSGPDSFTPIDFKMRFPALDGIRALAVTMVFALHYGGGAHGGPLLNIINQLRLRGWIGVDLFFALSGFLITGILYDTRFDSHFFKRFFGRRSVRIFPVFYLVFSILLLLTPVFRYHWRIGHLPFLVYMGNMAMGVDPSLETIRSANHPDADAHLIHLWSLCVEEQFYFLWPMVVWLVRDRVRLIRIAAVLSTLALVFRIAMVLYVSPVYFEGWMVHQLPFRMDSLLIGAILALLLRGEDAYRWQRRCRVIFPLTSAATIVLCIASPDLGSPWLFTIGFSMIAVASSALVGITLCPGTLIFRLFHLRPLRALGKYSYGFYVYHVIWAGFWGYLIAILTVLLKSSVLANGIIDVFSFAFTFMVARLSYNFVEIRFLRFKERFEYDSEIADHKIARTVA